MHLGRTDSKDPRQPMLWETLPMRHPENSIVSANRKFRQELRPRLLAMTAVGQWHSLLTGTVGTKSGFKMDLEPFVKRFNGHLQQYREMGLKDPKHICLQIQAATRRQLWEQC